MDLDGARNAKAEIFGRLFGALTDPEPFDPTVPDLSLPFDDTTTGPSASFRGIMSGLSRFSVSGAIATVAARLPAPPAMARVGRMRSAPPAIAVGIQRSRAKEGTNLVLVAPNARLRTHPLVEQAIKLAKGEAKFVTGGEPRPMAFWQPARRRPLLLGTSVSHHQVSAGTLGAFVRLNDGAIGFISNNHVLANVNKAVAGDSIIQPGKADGGTVSAGDVIGTLRAFVPLLSGDAATNLVDCAAAALDPSLGPSVEVVCGDSAPGLSLKGLATDDLFADDAVWKVGRTTGLTNGRVFAVEVDNYVVDMGTSWAPFRCRFDNQIQVYAEDRAFAGPGDSGSVLLDHDGQAHALLFAGTVADGPTGTGLATLNPLQVVLAQLDATLWIG